MIGKNINEVGGLAEAQPIQGRMGQLEIGDIELPYVEQGEGEPVLFVHGSNSDCRIWDAHREIIASRFRVIALTQRYFGTKAWSDAGEKFSIQNHADDLGAFIEGLELGPVNLVGWSTGAAACLTMTAQNPNLVKRVFLHEPALATFVTAPEDQKIALEDRLAMSADAKTLADSGDLAGTVRKFMDGVNAKAGTFDGLSPAPRTMMIENARMLPLLFAGPPPPSITETGLRDLAVPVTLVLGGKSRPFYRIAALAVQALLPNVNFKIIKNARHLWPIQEPAAFSRLVLDFLDSA